MRSTLIVHTRWSATQNDSYQVVLFKFFGRHQTRVQLAIYVKFTDPTSDQMRILRSKIQNLKPHTAHNDIDTQNEAHTTPEPVVSAGYRSTIVVVIGWNDPKQFFEVPVARESPGFLEF